MKGKNESELILDGEKKINKLVDLIFKQLEGKNIYRNRCFF
jgi:hypothetical protein